MGIQKQCKLLNWGETKSANEVVRRNGVWQFLRLYSQFVDLQSEALLWGEEVEHLLVKLDKEKKVARAAIRASTTLKWLTSQHDSKLPGHWMPEGVEFQIESIPREPYSGLLEDLIVVEKNMKRRRDLLQSRLSDGEYGLTFTSFPRCGCAGFTDPYFPTQPESGYKFNFIPEEVITSCTVRYRTMEANFLTGAGEEYAINIPVFQDEHTRSPWIDDISWPRGKPDHVYMDCRTVILACNSLHVTFQALNLRDVRNMYDQFAVITPIMMALTAGSPITRGYLTEHDSRWDAMEQASDDRSPQEKLPQQCADGTNRYLFSRTSSVPWLLSEAGMEFNDRPAAYNNKVYEDLIEEGVDEQMAMHIAIMMKRDVLLAFEDYKEPRTGDTTEDFDNINTTIWPTVRLKFPIPDGSAGWRVEFRPMGIQLTDFENASFTIFVILLTRIIREFCLNFLIPVSKIRDNIDKAVLRDAARTGKFHFGFSSDRKEFAGTEMTSMSVNEIINGKGEDFAGIIPMMHQYLDTYIQNTTVRQKLNDNLKLVSYMASGERPTQARWIREFVLNHPEYKQDSVVTERIQYDLFEKCLEKTHEFERQ